MSRDVTQICAGCSGGPDYVELGSGAPPCQPSYRMRTVTVQSLSIRKALAQVMRQLSETRMNRDYMGHGLGGHGSRSTTSFKQLSLELLLLLSLLGYHTCPSRNGGFGLDCPQQVTQRLSTQYPELKDTSFRCSTDKRLSSDVANLCNHDASVMYVALERADSCPH